MMVTSSYHPNTNNDDEELSRHIGEKKGIFILSGRDELRFAIILDMIVSITLMFMVLVFLYLFFIGR